MNIVVVGPEPEPDALIVLGAWGSAVVAVAAAAAEDG